MKINYDEFAKILDTFLESPGAFITLKDLNFFEVKGAEEESLHFHLLLLIENGLICNRNLETGDPRLLGFVFTSRGDWRKSRSNHAYPGRSRFCKRTSSETNP